ncbi:hypothetical protein AWB68_04311 [Caballeronia choica]|jgi:hypothetical protein|uniref:Lipoprotein n=1 Tax=Caballeronia choica TaxID=326476 RepID=A0A158JUQ7_9BURK|nr:hypothetical protein [Caballeronia choica]SAL72684.1 hypothetical protein AWB68_04311 [Caballeronia choica]
MRTMRVLALLCALGLTLLAGCAGATVSGGASSGTANPPKMGGGSY